MHETHLAKVGDDLLIDFLNDPVQVVINIRGRSRSINVNLTLENAGRLTGFSSIRCSFLSPYTFRIDLLKQAITSGTFPYL